MPFSSTMSAFFPCLGIQYKATSSFVSGFKVALFNRQCQICLVAPGGKISLCVLFN